MLTLGLTIAAPNQQPQAEESGRRVIALEGKLDDATTRALMESSCAFRWVERLGKAEALWKAECDLRAAGHPLRDVGLTRRCRVNERARRDASRRR